MRIISSESLHEGWPPISRHLVEFEDGRQRHWISFDFDDGVAILALTTDRKVVLVRQHLLGTDELEHMLPGGVMEDGENLEEAARRELLEETGYAAGQLEYLFRYVNLPSYARGWVHLFLARDVTPRSSKVHPVEIEGVELFEVDEAVSLAARGGFPSSSVAMAVLALPRILAERA